MNIPEEANLEFKLRKTDETENYFLEEIKHNDLISEKYENTCKYLNYIKQLLILVSGITRCFSISAFVSLICVPVGITSSAVGIKLLHSLQGCK